MTMATTFLARCATDLATFGYRLGGVVQSNMHRRGRCKCDIYLKDLLSGEESLISSDRGKEARGRRLDHEQVDISDQRGRSKI
jgi:nucleoside-triphosphatase THEP1